MKSAKIAYIGILSALSIIFGYIESFFPPPVAIPGIKLGISNIVVLFTILKMSRRDAFFVMLIKVTVCSLLFSGMNTFLYSLFGGIFSIFAMSILYKFNFTPIGISVGGGVFHNIGQITVAAILLNSASVFYYLPVLIFSGIAVGIIIGALTKTVIHYLK